MPQRLSPGIPAKPPDEYRRRIEAQLAEIRDDLARLESGDIGPGETSGAVERRALIARHKEAIGTYEALLASLDSGVLL